MDMSPAQLEELMALAAALRGAAHRSKGALIAAAAQRLNLSTHAVRDRLKKITVAKPRKARSDRGAHKLTREEAMLISATVEHTRRLTGTGTIQLEDAVDELRAAGKIAAGSVDESTGEFTPLSLSAIRRAMQHYGCHPGQLAQPSAAVEIASKHPNHYWQIDASVGRQWYMADDGAKDMPAAEFYRGKPQNFTRINDRRLIRYVVTDHCTGFIRLFYVLKAESAMNVIAALINAMTPTQGIAMHGRPILLGCDKGTETELLHQFCDALDIKIWAHAAGNPRALGSAEVSNNIIETSFEAAMKLRHPVASLEEINRAANLWCRWFNATKQHSRHGMTRQDAYLRITAEQLRPAPAPDVMRELATSKRVECTVRNRQIKFKSARWDVSGLPMALEGAKVLVGINPFDVDSVRISVTGEDGKPAFFHAPKVVLGEWNFSAQAAIAGEAFIAHAETPADAARKEVERLAYQVATDEQAKASRKAKRVAFDSALDPTNRWGNAPLPTFIPRAGTPSQIQAPAIIEPQLHRPVATPRAAAVPLSHFEMARQLKWRVEDRGGAWSAELYQRMAALWPAGVVEDSLDDCAVQLLRGGLRAVAGGAA